MSEIIEYVEFDGLWNKNSRIKKEKIKFLESYIGGITSRELVYNQRKIPKKKQLIKDLKYINEQLDSTQSLPINPNTEDAFHIFKYSGILSAIHEGK